MSASDIKMADRVKVEEQCRLAVSVKATVNADTDPATILADVPDAAEYIDIVGVWPLITSKADLVNSLEGNVK